MSIRTYISQCAFRQLNTFTNVYIIYCMLTKRTFETYVLLLFVLTLLHLLKERGLLPVIVLLIYLPSYIPPFAIPQISTIGNVKHNTIGTNNKFHQRPIWKMSIPTPTTANAKDIQKATKNILPSFTISTTVLSLEVK